MTPEQKFAIEHACLLAEETLQEGLGKQLDNGRLSQILSVNRGYE